MISTLEKEITFRFLKARKNDGFLNVISIFSFIGISLGVAVLIIVMSVMNGFRTELINKIVGFNSHITVKPYDIPINLDKINELKIKLTSKNLILSNSGEAIIIREQSSKGILLRGYLQNDFSKLELINNKNFTGGKKLEKNFISIGRELSFNLDLKIGDKRIIENKDAIMKLVTHYIVNEKNHKGLPINDVSRFHLGNGAIVEDIVINANVSEIGFKRSYGVMVNYLYELKNIEKNHEDYINNKKVIFSEKLKKYM